MLYYVFLSLLRSVLHLKGGENKTLSIHKVKECQFPNAFFFLTSASFSISKEPRFAWAQIWSNDVLTFGIGVTDWTKSTGLIYVYNNEKIETKKKLKISLKQVRFHIYIRTLMIHQKPVHIFSLSLVIKNGNLGKEKKMEKSQRRLRKLGKL